MRVFPGKTSPDDSLPDLRRQVKLVATIHLAIAGVPAYFKVWDVDDPFDQLHGPGGADDVLDVALIDNDVAGHDNRPTGEDPITDTVTTRGQRQPVRGYASVDGNQVIRCRWMSRRVHAPRRQL